MAGWFRKIFSGPAPVVPPVHAPAVPSAAEEVAHLKRSANEFLDAGKLALAVADFQRASVLAPSDAGAWTGLGFAQYESGKLDEAARSLGQAVKLAPGSADAHFLLGNIARDQGRMERAIAAWREAVTLQPDLAVAWLELGHALEAAGQVEQAREAYLRLLALDPAQLEVRLDAGRVAVQENIRRHLTGEAVTHVPQPGPSTGARKTLRVEGWRGVNHSYALINQYQILELLRRDDLSLLHRDLPFPQASWNAASVGAGFSGADQALIAGVAAPGDADDAADADAIYRICTPFRSPGPARPGQKTLSFLITEYGLVKANFVPGAQDRAAYTRDGNLVVTSSRWSRDRLVDDGFDAESIHVISCGVSPAIFRPLPAPERLAKREALGIRPDETVFLNLGAAFWNKGVDVLVLAFALLRQRHPAIRLVLKDQRALYNVVTAEAAIRKLAGEHPALFTAATLDAIMLVGSNLSQQQLRAMYCVADCYVSPYRAEGFNLPVLEAMACGVPVVVTEGGATDDFCPPGAAIRVPGTLAGKDNQEGGVVRYIEPQLDAVVEAMARFAGGGPGVERASFDAAVQALLPQKSWGAAAAQLRQLMD